MATISRTGISNGGTIQPSHITNIIDALDGTSTTTTVIASGSFSGSLVGTLTGTASFATNALSASYAINVPTTSSYALSALSSSYALTASYAINGGGGGTGAGFPYSGSAQITGSMGITGSLQVTAGITGSLLGSASYAVNVGVVRTSTAATFYPTFVDSSNATTGSEQIYTAANITVAPDRGLLQATSVSGSITGSVLVQTALNTVQGATLTINGNLDGPVTGSSNLILNLRDIAKSAGKGQFVLPTNQPGGALPGACYLNLIDPPELLVFDGSNWRTLTFV